MKISELLKKYKDIEIDDSKVEELKDYLGIQENDCEFKVGDNYCGITFGGPIRCVKWEGISLDKNAYEIGNCYKTKQEALNKVEYLKIQAELERFAKKYNEEKIDFRNDTQTKHFISCCYTNAYGSVNVDTDYTFNYKYNGVVYFTSRELCEQAIELIGKDRLKKYYFGVEE